MFSSILFQLLPLNSTCISSVAGGETPALPPCSPTRGQDNKSRALATHGTSQHHTVLGAPTLPSMAQMPDPSPRACWGCGPPVSAQVCNTTGGSSSALLRDKRRSYGLSWSPQQYVEDSRQGYLIQGSPRGQRSWPHKVWMSFVDPT